MFSIFQSFQNIWPIKLRYFNRRPRVSTQIKSSNVDAEPFIQYLSPLESKVVTLQKIMIWEKPGKSLFAVITANVFFWYFAFGGIRFFYGISMLSLAFFLHHQWVYSIWPEISIPTQEDQEGWTPVHPRVLSVPEVSRYLEKIWIAVRDKQSQIFLLRRKQPGMFCIGMTLLLSVLWMIGHFITGTILLYTTMMLALCGPGFMFHAVPKSVYTHFEYVYSIMVKGKMGDSCEINEFLPEEASPEAQLALRIPLSPSEPEALIQPHLQPAATKSGEARKGNSKGQHSASTGSSLIEGLLDDDFPSFEDSLDGSNLTVPHLPMESFVSSDAMSFVPSHFGDSTDEEEEFLPGMSFRPCTTIHQPQTTHIEVGTVPPMEYPNILTSLSQQLLAAMTTTVPENTQQPTTSSSEKSSIDEDFEMISDDDLQ